MLVHTYKKDERAEKMKELKEKVNFFGFEQTLLSICMKDEEKLIETMTQIKPEYFSSRPNQYIFQTMRILLESKKSIDPAAVYEVLTDEQKKEVDELLGNGLDYIETIYESYSSPKNLQMYIDHVKLAHARRELSIKFDELKDEIMKNESEDLLAYLSKVEGELQEIILKYQTSTDTQSLEDVAERCMEDLITGKKRELGIKTGFDSYDRLTRGLRPNELVIIGARSKMGKSVLSMNWAKQIAKQGKPILYIDTEMTLEEQFFRMLSNETGFTQQYLEDREWFYNQEKRDLVQTAYNQLRKLPFYHKYMPVFTPEEVASLIRLYKIKYDIQAVFFDYIKMPSSQVREKENQELGRLASILKDVAGELKIPIVAPVQLNRAAIGVEPHEGTVAGSDEIFRYCTQLLFLFKKEREQIEEYGEEYGEYVLKLERQRNGRSNVYIHIDFEHEIQKMVDKGFMEE